MAGFYLGLEDELTHAGHAVTSRGYYEEGWYNPRHRQPYVITADPFKHANVVFDKYRGLDDRWVGSKIGFMSGRSTCVGTFDKVLYIYI